jgi:hypothetical protein
MYVVCLQLVQEFKLLLVVGRRLVFPAQSSAAVSADLTTQLQFQAADGTTAMRTVSLAFRNAGFQNFRQLSHVSRQLHGSHNSRLAGLL